MSRSFFFILAAMVVKVYFSVILILLKSKNSASNDTQLTEVGNVSWCKPLRWRVPPGPVVALASYPGSGNTWLRYLLQQSTGIITGSLYMDHELYENGFPGEKTINGSVLVVKTHDRPEEKFEAAILLIRNPRDAILSNYNSAFGRKGLAPKTAFRKLTPEEDKLLQRSDWSKHVKVGLDVWESFHKVWLNEFHRPLHIVCYEELVQDLIPTLDKILNFLRVKVTMCDLECTLRNREGIHRRQKHKDFDPFTPKMMEKIDEVRSRAACKRLKTRFGVFESFNFVSPTRHNHSRLHRHSQRTQPESRGRRRSFLYA